jgi:hypothetical protein
VAVTAAVVVAAVATAGKLLSSIVMIEGPAQAGPFLWRVWQADLTMAGPELRPGLPVAWTSLHGGNANDKSNA